MIGNYMKVYVNDMLVKSIQHIDHLQYLDKAFDLLRQYKVKLNPEKYIFGMTFRDYLGYLVIQWSIEADPDQISTILNMRSTTYVKEVQMLNGRLVALNRFITQSTNKCKPFLRALKKNRADFHWNEEYKTAFQRLKWYLASPPLLSKPSSRETMYLYIAVSESTVSGALVRKDEGS